jgi:hypothetical protein
MTNLVTQFFKLSVLVCLIPALAGCAVVGLAGPAAVSGGAAGVDYTFTNNVYKTISHPVAEVDVALFKTLKKMNINEMTHNATEDKVSVKAATDKLTIYIDLVKVTPTVTNIEVNAKKGVFLKDKAMATEIIMQTEKSLEGDL